MLVLGFRFEILAFSKGIDTRNILSLVPPWAATSKICSEMPGRCRRAIHPRGTSNYRQCMLLRALEDALQLLPAGQGGDLFKFDRFESRLHLRESSRFCLVE